MLLRLGEGAIGDGHLATADPDGPSCPSTLQRVRDDVVAALPDLLVVVERRVDEGLHLPLGQGVHHRLVVVDQEQELHRVLLAAGVHRYLIGPSGVWLRLMLTLGSRPAGPEIDTAAYCSDPWPPGVVGAEGPDMTFEVAAGEAAPAVVLVLDVDEDDGAAELGPRVDDVGVGDDHVGRLRREAADLV